MCDMTMYEYLEPFDYDGSDACHCGGTMAVAEVRGVYDGGLFFMCMTNRAHVAHRWSDEHMRRKTEMVWGEWDAANQKAAIGDTSPVTGDDTRDSTVDNGDA